ncbi:glycosyltransferase family protein [Arthrobacter sp. HLT1-21]
MGKTQFIYCADESVSPDMLDGVGSQIIGILATSGQPVLVMAPGHFNRDSQNKILETFSNVAFWETKNTTMGAKELAWKVFLEAEKFEEPIVVSQGLSLSISFSGNDKVSKRMWGILSNQDVELHTKSTKKVRPSFERALTVARQIIVHNTEARKALQLRFPGLSSKIALVEPSYELSSNPAYVSSNRQFDMTIKQLIMMETANHRVVVYADVDLRLLTDSSEGLIRFVRSIASENQFVILVLPVATMHEDLRRSIADCGNLHAVYPSVRSHQNLDGFLLPRYAAWHLSVLADTFDASAVLTDLSTTSFALANTSLLDRLYPVFGYMALEEMTQAKSAIEPIVEKCRRLVFPNEEARSTFESHFPAATSKTLILPHAMTAHENSNGENANAAVQLANELGRLISNHPLKSTNGESIKLLFVGHDFKFAGELFELLANRREILLRVDHWEKQNIHNEAVSARLNLWADVIFCEFASHNAVRYSWAKQPGQSLIVRFHGYELHSDWIRDINIGNIDMVIFVSEFYRQMVVEKLNWPIEKTMVIPNMVDVSDFNRTKLTDSRFHLGIAGIVPILKRPDRALDLLENLLQQDNRYTLHVRGRVPWDYGWMWKEDYVRDAYEAFYERLALNPDLRRRVAFESFAPDMGRWFRKIGWVLSPSTRETFHLAPVEGMASGAVPVVWNRDGAGEIFEADWIHDSTERAAEYIQKVNADSQSYSEASERATSSAGKYDLGEVGKVWLQLLGTVPSSQSFRPPVSITSQQLEDSFAKSPTPAHLGRWLTVLLRDGDEAQIDEILETHSDLVGALPSYLSIGIHSRIARKAIVDGELSVPSRSRGAAYLAAHGVSLYVVSPTVTEKLQNEDANVRLISTTAPSFLGNGYDLGVSSRSVTFIGNLQYTLMPLKNVLALRIDKLIIASADAIVREARVHRPEYIRSQRDYWVALPAIIAARRLGIPFLCDAAPCFPDHSDTYIDKYVVENSDHIENGAAFPAQVQKMTDTHLQYLKDTADRELRDLRVGLIADEFTARTVSQSFNTVPLSRASGYVEVAIGNLDVIFVESAWEGPNNEWRRGVAYYAGHDHDLEKILAVAQMRNIPVIFWNKEDPVHFKAFSHTAANIAHVFTTDGDMVGNYLAQEDSKTLTASSISFYAEPLLHNPLPSERAYEHTVSYAGTYYGPRFADRSEELDRIFEAAKPFGLTIYDRQVNVPNSPYRFPDGLSAYVKPGVPYDEVLKVYKAHPVSINVNSASDSPTMFSRRIVEVAASGGLVLSGKGRGINEQIPGIIATDSTEKWTELLGQWMNDEQARLAAVWKQLRAVTRAHLAEHALTLMMRTAGLPIKAPSLQNYSIVTPNLNLDIISSIILQTWRPTTVYALKADTEAIMKASRNGIETVVVPGYDSLSGVVTTKWIAEFDSSLPETHYEDLLHAARFGHWHHIVSETHTSPQRGEPLVRIGPNTHARFGVLDVGLLESADDFNSLPSVAGVQTLTWRVP